MTVDPCGKHQILSSLSLLPSPASIPATKRWMYTVHTTSSTELRGLEQSFLKPVPVNGSAASATELTKIALAMK